MKKALKIILIIVFAAALLTAAYVAYVFIGYHRLGTGEISVCNAVSLQPVTEEPYHLVSWNIGFGAYTSDYDFFMDGGTQSWAESPERLAENIEDIGALLQAQNADVYLVQEVDTDGTRSYHMDERTAIAASLSTGDTAYAYTFAQNYDSPFLFYPFTQPHGANCSGLLTFSAFAMTSATRVELPVESSVMKLVDLDRCYSRQTIPMANGKQLILYNLHLSAYTSDGKIANEQLKLLISDMQTAYAAGNYCIAGGDFNKDLPGNSAELFGVEAPEGSNWAQPLPAGIIPEKLTLIIPLDEENPHASCRTAGAAYVPETSFRITVDGFLVSDNVEVLSTDVIETDYAYSDHNPVYMDFILHG